MQLNANQVIIQRDIIDTFSSFISVGFASERNDRKKPRSIWVDYTSPEFKMAKPKRISIKFTTNPRIAENNRDAPSLLSQDDIKMLGANAGEQCVAMSLCALIYFHMKGIIQSVGRCSDL